MILYYSYNPLDLVLRLSMITISLPTLLGRPSQMLRLLPCFLPPSQRKTPPLAYIYQTQNHLSLQSLDQPLQLYIPTLATSLLSSRHGHKHSILDAWQSLQ